MGWAPFTSASSFKFTGGVGSGSSVPLVNPDAVLPGDTIYMSIACGASVTSGPAGWTKIGSESSNTAGSFHSLWKHTFALGDAMTNNWTSAGLAYAVAWVIRSDGTPSLVTDTSTGPTTSTSASFAKTSPTTSKADLRIAIYFANSYLSSVGTWPTVTPSADNPIGLGMTLLADGGHVGVFSHLVYYSLWSDPSGLDANPEVVTIVSAQWFTRVLDFTDGTDHNGMTSDEMALYGVDTDVVAVSPSSLEEELSSAAGKFGGGAHIL